MDSVGAPATGDSAATTSSSTASPTVTTSSTATAAPATQAPENSITDSTGPLPFERHKAILEGVYKERDQFKSDFEAYKQKLSWAESVNRDEFQAVGDWYTQAHSNPVEFALKLVDELSSDQQHAPVLRSHAARLLRAARGSQPEPELKPDIPVFNDQGQEVSRAYSGDTMDKIIGPLRAKIEALEKQLSPISQRVASDEQREQSSREAQRIKATVSKYPKADEHWKAIQVKAYELARADQKLSPGEAVLRGYLEVVLPTLEPNAQAKVLSDLQTKATAQTANPGSPGSSAKPKFKKDDFGAAAEYYAAHPDEALAMANR